MTAESMDDIEALTKRFKDYIDRVQAAYESSRPVEPGPAGIKPVSESPSRKLYTVVSPVDAMTRNVKSVLDALDRAIDHIDVLARPAGKVTPETPASQGVYTASPGTRKFTEEELDFLVRTFNTILKSSDEERKRLFTDMDNEEKPSE
jgi:hypothetical protein